MLVESLFHSLLAGSRKTIFFDLSLKIAHYIMVLMKLHMGSITLAASSLGLLPVSP